MKTKILLKARWLLCGLLAVFLTTNAWADEEVIYTLTPASGSNSNYASNCDVAIDGITWNITGNSTMQPWRIGGKSISNTNRTVYSKTAMESAVTKVELTVGAASNITVNSLKLIVASDAAFNNQIDEVSATFTANSTMTFTPSTPATEWASGAFYKFEFNVTVSGSSNKFVEFKSAKFYAPESGTPAVTLSSISVSGDLSDKTYENTDRIDLTGLVVTGTYSDASTNNVTADATWEVRTDGTSESFTPSTYVLTAGQTSVQVRATVDDKQSDWVIINGLTVTAHVATPGEYTINLNNDFYGVATGNNPEEQSATQNDITVVSGCTSNASSKTYYDIGHIRYYANSYLELSVPDGYTMTSIEFTAGGKWDGSITASVGTYDNNSKTWTGNSQNVNFSFGAQNRISSVVVTYAEVGSCSAPTITTQPVGAIYSLNDVATALSIEAEACDKISGTLSYQWYSNTTESNEGGVAITGEEAASFTPATTAEGVVYYYCVVSQGEASVATDAVAVTVEGPEVGVSFEQEASAYTDWTFANMESQHTGDITAHTKSYYGTTGGKATASMVTANKIAAPGTLSFFVSKQTTNTTTSTWYVKVSSDGTDWTEVTSHSATSMTKGTWVEVSADLSAYTNVYVGIFYDGSTAVRNIDDVILTTRVLVASAVTYNDAPDHGMVSIEKDDIELASGTTVNEGDVLDVFLAGDDGYVGTVAVTATESGEDITTEVYNAETGKLTMPAYPITVTATFAVGVETPVFDLADGIYATTQLVLLSTSTTGASIYYTMTTDGTTPADPTNASTLYDANEGIELNARGTYKIKAVAYKNENYSSIAAAEYTLNIPYVFATVADMVNYLETNSLMELDNVVVTGVVSEIKSIDPTKYERAQYYISDNGTAENQLYIYNGYYLNGTSFTSTTELEVGDKVTIQGNYTTFGTTKELDQNNQITAITKKVLSSVVVNGTPDQTDYSAGDQFLPTGLVVTANYSNTGYSKVVTDDVTWETSLDNNVVTATGEVLVTATYNNMVSDPYAVNVTVSSKALTSIELSETAYTIYKEQTYTKPTVTAHFDDNSTENITAIATDDAATAFDNTVAGPNTVTVSYTYGADTKTAQYTVTVQAYANADDAPYTVTEALAIIEGFSSNSADEIVVAGTVSVENKDGNKNRYKISDGTNELLVYGGKGFNKANFTADNYPKVGDVVVVKGNVINYNNETPEFASGKSYLLSQVRPAWLSIEDVAQLEVGAEDMALADLTITTESTGDITYVSEDETKLTIEEDKLHAVAPGTVNVTANMAATNNVNALNYAATSTTFQVTVVGTLPRYAVTFAANGGEGDAPVMEDQLEGATFNLPANTFTYTGFQFAGWNDGTNTYTAGAAYTMPADAVTFTAQWDDVCAWATVYTSNVVFTGSGDSYEANSKVNIDDVDYKAQKVGSGGNNAKTGSVTVTVPAGTHTLHFHAAAWNSASSMTIAASGVTNMSVSSFAIAADAGVKNSGTYTLAGDPIDQHFHFTFDAVAEETTITFSKTAGTDNRFVMYGINQEGGPELKSLTIGGTATTTAYEIGQSFNTAGLTVSAVYALGGVDQEPVDVTDQVTWNINPTEFTLTSQTSVTVTASLETKTTSTTIPVTVSETSIPGVTHAAIVVKNANGKYYAMGQQMNTGHLNAVELAGIINGQIINVAEENRTAITWTITETADGVTFQAQNGKYLKGQSEKDTKLAWSDVAVYWNWNDSRGCYVIGSGNRSFFMKDGDFRYYSLENINLSTSCMFLDKYIDIDLTDKEIVTLRNGLENGKIGTMCWNADIYEVEGAYFFEPEMKQADGVCFAEAAKEGGVYPMGKPYVFQATGEEIRAVVSKTTTDVAGTNNGLHGVLGETVDVNGENYYIIYQNRLYTANNNYIVANRAYIVKSELPGASANPAPNRRRLVIGRDNLPTGIEAIVLNAEQVKKVLVDGQIYIVRDGKLYDLTGKVVR